MFLSTLVYLLYLLPSLLSQTHYITFMDIFSMVKSFLRMYPPHKAHQQSQCDFSLFYLFKFLLLFVYMFSANFVLFIVICLGVCCSVTMAPLMRLTFCSLSPSIKHQGRCSGLPSAIFEPLLLVSDESLGSGGF